MQNKQIYEGVQLLIWKYDIAGNFPLIFTPTALMGEISSCPVLSLTESGPGTRLSKFHTY